MLLSFEFFSNSTKSRSFIRPFLFFSQKENTPPFIVTFNYCLFSPSQPLNPSILGLVSFLRPRFKMFFRLIRFICLFIYKYFLKGYDCCLPDFYHIQPKLFPRIHTTISCPGIMMTLNWILFCHKNL